MPESTLAAAEKRLWQLADDPLICNISDDIRAAITAVLVEYDRRGAIGRRARHLIAGNEHDPRARAYCWAARYVLGEPPYVEPAPAAPPITDRGQCQRCDGPIVEYGKSADGSGIWQHDRDQPRDSPCPRAVPAEEACEPMPETTEAFMKRFYSPNLIGPADGGMTR